MNLLPFHLNSWHKNVHHFGATASCGRFVSLFNKKIYEGSPGREDGSLDATSAETLLSEGALKDQLLHIIRIFGRLHGHRHCPQNAVVNLGDRIKR